MILTKKKKIICHNKGEKSNLKVNYPFFITRLLVKAAHPELALRIIAPDFNQAKLKTTLPKYHQYVDCPTKRSNTVDKVYCKIPPAYKAVPNPPLGQSISIYLCL